MQSLAAYAAQAYTACLADHVWNKQKNQWEQEIKQYVVLDLSRPAHCQCVWVTWGLLGSKRSSFTSGHTGKLLLLMVFHIHWCARLVFATQVLYELPTNMQWCFDIQWCPRNPAILSAASFDGRLSIYSIMGGSTDGLRQKHVDQVLRNMQLRKWLERGWSMGLWVAFGGCSNCMLAGVLICCERKK